MPANLPKFADLLISCIHVLNLRLKLTIEVPTNMFIEKSAADLNKPAIQIWVCLGRRRSNQTLLPSS